MLTTVARKLNNASLSVSMAFGRYCILLFCLGSRAAVFHNGYVLPAKLSEAIKGCTICSAKCPIPLRKSGHTSPSLACNVSVAVPRCFRDDGVCLARWPSSTRGGYGPISFHVVHQQPLFSLKVPPRTRHTLSYISYSLPLTRCEGSR